MSCPVNVQALPGAVLEEVFSPENMRARNSFTQLSFPKSRSALWDGSPAGEKLRLLLCAHRKLRVVLLEKALRLAQRHARRSHKPRLLCFFLGSACVSSDEEGVIVTLDRFDPGRDQGGSTGQVPSASLPGDVLVPCWLSAQTEETPEAVVQSEAELHQCFQELQQVLSSRKTLDLSHLLKLRAHLLVSQTAADAAAFSLCWWAVCPAAGVDVQPVRAVPVVPTALLRSLTGAGRPPQTAARQRGFLTMDQTRKLVLLLESDPKAPGLPLVGLWLSGVAHVSHPQVWACCLRFMVSSALQDRVLSDSGCFLLVLFGSAHRAPQFFQCRGSRPGPGPGPLLDFQLLSGSQSSTLYLQVAPLDGRVLTCELGPEDGSTRAEVFRAAQTSFSRTPPPAAPLSVSDQDSGVEDEDFSPRPSPSPHPLAPQARRILPSVPELSLLIDGSFSSNHSPARDSGPAHRPPPAAAPPTSISSSAPKPPHLHSTPNPNLQQPCSCCSSHAYSCTPIFSSPPLLSAPPAAPVNHQQTPPAPSLQSAPPVPQTSSHQQTPPLSSRHSAPPPSSSYHQQTPPPSTPLVLPACSHQHVPPFSSHQQTPPPFVSSHQQTPPPFISSNQQTPPPFISSNQQTPPPFISSNQQTPPPSTPPVLPACSHQHMPPFSSFQQTQPPFVSPHQQTPPPFVSSHQQAPPPGSHLTPPALHQLPPSNNPPFTPVPPTFSHQQTPPSSSRHSAPPPSSFSHQQTPPPSGSHLTPPHLHQKSLPPSSTCSPTPLLLTSSHQITRHSAPPPSSSTSSPHQQTPPPSFPPVPPASTFWHIPAPDLQSSPPPSTPVVLPALPPPPCVSDSSHPAAADPLPPSWPPRPSCCCDKAGVVPSETVQLLLQQDHQLRLLQAQIQMLLEAQGTLRTSRTTTSVAVETGASLFWGNEPEPLQEEDQPSPGPPPSSSSSPSSSSHGPAGRRAEDRDDPGQEALASSPGPFSGLQSPVLGESVSMYETPDQQQSFYQNLMTQLSSRLQESDRKQEVQDRSRRSSLSVSDHSRSSQSSSGSSSRRKQKKKSSEGDPVVRATLRRLQQLGVSVDEDHLMDADRTRAVENASTLASINPAAVVSRLTAPEAVGGSALFPGGSVDLSLEANAIALRYLSDSQLSRLSLGGHAPQNVPAPSSCGDSLLSPSNMSLATRKYMRRYGLIEEGEEQEEVLEARQPLTDALNLKLLPQSQLIRELRPKMQLLAGDKENRSDRRPHSVREPEGSVGNLLDLSRLRQLPKLF